MGQHLRAERKVNAVAISFQGVRKHNDIHRELFRVTNVHGHTVIYSSPVAAPKRASDIVCLVLKRDAVVDGERMGKGKV